MALLSRSVSPRCRPSIRLSVSSSFLFFLFLLYLHSFSKTTSFYICLKIKLTSHKSQERIPQESTSQSILHINIFSYTFHTNIDLKLEKNESNIEIKKQQGGRAHSTAGLVLCPPPGPATRRRWIPRPRRRHTPPSPHLRHCREVGHGALRRRPRLRTPPEPAGRHRRGPSLPSS